ncbi:MAG: flippase-like domain-containing protein [Cyclobacteriaceae bacterium]
MNIRSIVTYLISLGIGAVLLLLAFQKVNLSEFFTAASEVEYMWVLLSIFLSLVSHWLRAYRWNILLEPFGYHLETGRTFLAVMSGYLANLAVPRLGEVTKCGVLKKNDNVSISLSFGTVITERVIDFLILLFIIILGFILQFDKIFEFFYKIIGIEQLLENKLLLFGVALSLTLAFIIGLLIIRNNISSNNNQGLIGKIQSFIKELIQGLFSVRKIKNIWGFIAATIIIWVLYFFMSYVIVFSIAETSDLGMLAGLSILVAGALAMVVPVPGGVGAYHLTVSGILVIYGIESKTGLFFATLLHSSQFVSILVFGGLSLLTSLFIAKKENSISLENAN